MATIHGKDAVLYMGDGTNAAVQITEAAEYEINIESDKVPDPALQDSWETRLKGLMRFSGAFNGNLDDAQDTLWDAMVASSAAAFYLYPAAATATRYYYGNIWPDVSIDGGVTGKQNFSVTFEGDGQLAKNPA